MKAIPRPRMLVMRVGVPVKVMGITPIDPNTGKRTVHTDDPQIPYFRVEEGEEVVVCGNSEIRDDHV